MVKITELELAVPKVGSTKNIPMYKAHIDFFYWLLIKFAQSENGSSLLEVESAANKIVLFNFQGSLRKN